jgi:hypothetical protein
MRGVEIERVTARNNAEWYGNAERSEVQKQEKNFLNAKISAIIRAHSSISLPLSLASYLCYGSPTKTMQSSPAGSE